MQSAKLFKELKFEFNCYIILVVKSNREELKQYFACSHIVVYILANNDNNNKWYIYTTINGSNNVI